MNVVAKRFMEMAKANNATLSLIAKELGMTVERLKKMLIRREPFTFTESQTLMAMFGAEQMVRVIDWRVVNVRKAM